MEHISVTLWNMFVIGGCSYLVFGLDHSGAWFLLALSILQTSGCSDCKKESK